jgi:hypothetical protein
MSRTQPAWIVTRHDDTIGTMAARVTTTCDPQEVTNEHHARRRGRPRARTRKRNVMRATNDENEAALRR